MGWFVGVRRRASRCCGCSLIGGHLAARQGHRHLGHQHPGRLGLRDHQLRLVDRHRPRRHADLGDPAAVPAGVAHLDQPLRRGDDAVRGGLRRPVPAAPLGPAVARLLAVPLSEHDGPLAAVPQPADLGRLRGLHLRHGVAAVLVRRPDPRPGDAARPGEEQGCAQLLYGMLRARLARLGAALARLRDGLPAARRASRRRWCSRCTRSCRFDFAIGIVPGWHTTIFPPYFVAGADLLRLRDGADAGDPAARRSTASKDFITDAPPREHGAR